MIEQEIVRAFTTIIAVVLGFLLAQVSEWVKSRRSSQRKEKALRKLINLEILQHVGQVKNYYEKVIQSHGEWNNKEGEFKFVQLADAAANTPFPFLSSDAWKDNIGEIVSVYDEKEIERLWNFQKKLERLSSLYMFFNDARNEKIATHRFHNATVAPVSGRIAGGLGFADTVREHAPEFKKLVADIVAFEYCA